MKNKCLCGCQRFVNKKASVGTNDYMVITKECFKCGKTLDVKLNLYNNSNKDSFISINKTSKLVYRWVWETYNDRALNREEMVHHIDGNRKNNKPSNLMVLFRSEHNRNLQYGHLVKTINELREENKCLKKQLKKYLPV
jgi:hypothetical protein